MKKGALFMAEHDFMVEVMDELKSINSRLDDIENSVGYYGVDMKLDLSQYKKDIIEILKTIENVVDEIQC